MASLSTYIEANYPSPSNGDSFLWGGVKYTFDSTPGVWIGELPDPGAVTDAATTATAPTNPNEGDLWYDGATLNVRVGTNWVEANPQPTAEDLDIGPVLVVQQAGLDRTSETTTLNFTTRTASSSAVNVKATTGNQAEIEIVFPDPPEVPADIPMSGPTPPEMGQVPTMSVLSTPAVGDPEWVDLPSIPTSIADFGDTSISDISNVDASSPMSDQVLSFDGTNWVPKTLADQTSVSIDAEGNTITISGVDTEIPVVDSMTISGQTLTLTRNGSASDLAVTLPVNEGATPTPILDVNNFTSVAKITFDDNFTLSGSANNVMIGAPEIPEVVPNKVAVQEAGTTVSTDVKTLNFASGATLSDQGNGNINITVTPSAGGQEVQTVYTNITEAENIVSSVEQSANNQTEFTLTGKSGGSRYRLMFRALNFKSAVKWVEGSAGSVRNLTIWGTRTFGLWDAGASNVNIARGAPNAYAGTWTSNTNLALETSEILMIEVDLKNNGSITFTTNGAGNTSWSQVAQNSSSEEQVIEMVTPEDPAEEPASPPPTTKSPPYLVSQENMCGPFWIPNPPSTANTASTTYIQWDNDTQALSAVVGTGLSTSLLTGGDNSAATKSLNGNAIWGFNKNRHPAGGLFIGQLKSGTTTGAGVTATTLTNMCTVVFPHEDDCGVMEYIKSLNLPDDAWNNQPVYRYDRLGGTYSGASSDRRIRAWTSSIDGQPNETFLFPTSATNDGRVNNTNDLSLPSNDLFAAGASITHNSASSLVGSRVNTFDSGIDQGPFGDQLKLNMRIPFDDLFVNNTTVHQRDFGEFRYTPGGSYTFSTQFVMVIPTTRNVLFFESRNSTPTTWTGSNFSGNKIYGFELGYRIFTPDVAPDNTTSAPNDSKYRFLSNTIRSREQAAGLEEN